MPTNGRILVLLFIPSRGAVLGYIGDIFFFPLSRNFQLPSFPYKFLSEPGLRRLYISLDLCCASTKTLSAVAILGAGILGREPARQSQPKPEAPSHLNLGPARKTRTILSRRPPCHVLVRRLVDQMSLLFARCRPADPKASCDGRFRAYVVLRCMRTF